ncbi:diacylglycerol kinase family enzyme [Sphingomonas sp. UYAg733]
MKNLWFITNPSSGSATPEKCQAIEAVFAERGLNLVGRTGFPDEPLPAAESLDTAKVDTVVLFAGDGTINAAVCALADWDGAILILPGGTMNLLAKALHGNADPAAIIHTAHEHAEKIALPFVEAGERRALVGLILGPVASWVRAREMVRAGKVRGLGRAMLTAWRRTFARGIRLEGVRGLHHRAQAVFVRPELDHLDVAAVDARDFRSITALGWEWLTGDWVAATAVTQVRATVIRVAGRKPALALFDGEPVMLEPDIPISGGMTARQFLKTVEAT